MMMIVLFCRKRTKGVQFGVSQIRGCAIAPAQSTSRRGCGRNHSCDSCSSSSADGHSSSPSSTSTASGLGSSFGGAGGVGLGDDVLARPANFVRKASRSPRPPADCAGDAFALFGGGPAVGTAVPSGRLPVTIVVGLGPWTVWGGARRAPNPLSPHRVGSTVAQSRHFPRQADTTPGSGF